MNELIPSRKFELRLMKVGIRVNIPVYEDFRRVYEKLKADNVSFYTYQTADTRPLKICVYGLPNMPIDDAKELLADINIAPEEIKKLTIKKPLYDNQVVYLLKFKLGSVKIADLRKVKHISQMVVRWEKFHPRSYDKVAQCHRCQLLGHSSSNCNLPPRCLVCAESHKTEDCPHKRNRHEITEARRRNQPVDSSYVKCALCGKKSHCQVSAMREASRIRDHATREAEASSRAQVAIQH